jgi:hypothetical protein
MCADFGVIIFHLWVQSKTDQEREAAGEENGINTVMNHSHDSRNHRILAMDVVE